MDKRGQLLMEAVVFIVLNIIFFSTMFYFVSIKANSNALYAEAYAKQVALLIDNARPGMKITLDLSDFYKKFDKGDSKGKIEIDPVKKAVVIKEVIKEREKEREKELYRHQFFANYAIEYRTENDKLDIDKISPEVKNG